MTKRTTEQHTHDNDDVAFNVVAELHSTMPKQPDTHKPHDVSTALAEQNRAQKSGANFIDGTSRAIPFSNFKAMHRDECTQVEPDYNLTHAAMVGELNHVNDKIWY